MRWVWGNMFTMDVPEGWKVHENGDVIEIIPPNPVGAAHISVLKRTRGGPVQKGEASELASNFARNKGIDSSKSSERDAGNQRIAHLQFQTSDPEGPWYWDVVVRVWPSRAVVCTYCHGGDETSQAVARDMFDSIEPADTRSLENARLTAPPKVIDSPPVTICPDA